MHVLGVARTDQRVLREAKALAHAGYDVTIVDIEGDPSRPREEDLDGLHLRHLIMPSRFKPTRFKPYFLVKQARITAAGARLLMRTKADIYHAHDANALLACYKAARRRRKPLVFDAHELPFVEPSTTRYRLITALAVRRLRQITPHCDGIITVSEPIAAEFHKRYGGKPAAIVRNTLSYTPRVTSDRLRDRLRERLGLPPTTRIGLYQGNFQADRGLDGLVRAGKYLAPDCVIVLMGRGGYEATLRELIDREDVGDRVKLLPAVPYAELLEWTASADVGLIIYPLTFSPNVLYCLPNKLFEFLMAGVPVLSSKLVAVEELLEQYEVGSVVPAVEPEIMGNAISAMLSGRERLARMRQNALAVSRADLSWEHEQQRLIALYAQLTGTERLSTGVS
jgi:glycosyltransferase involved in cell wall biosynthesis